MTETDIYVFNPTAPERRFVCIATPRGWVCGHCRNYNFGYSPEEDEQCARCQFVIAAEHVVPNALTEAWDKRFLNRVRRELDE